MSKPKKIITEYRNYYLPVDFPVLLLTGEHWKISDIPSPRLHFHNCLEIGVCHSWGGTMKFYSDPLRFQAGDVTCVPRNIPHTTWSDKGSESHWSYLFFDPNELFRDMLLPSDTGLDLSLFSYQNFRHILPKEEFPQIYTLTMSAIDELVAMRPNYRLSVKGLLLALSIELNRIQEQENTGFQEVPPPTDISVPENALVISPALNYIEDNYGTQFPVEKLAEVCHLSPTHFRRVFHSIMHTSPLNYLNSIRIMKACNLLRSTEESILTISELSGFASVSSFNRHFQEVIHQTPREYRTHSKPFTDASADDPRTTIIEFSGWMEPESDPY
ncbi:MAG TPA: AraC family transcriptional regulator [Candidatus Eisenbergiella merdavium]|uniref:AraC family transcriptional regulator n=1 Tax=Candidatus Eisenbergiella merdavium TaxID=2838551 RepID=A0A9D2SPQ5_9FIRM|nr:AraC family transcriptional regulator [Candidatus Eisenbergiella merdavium]